jgi:hypothetical protein
MTTVRISQPRSTGPPTDSALSPQKSRDAGEPVPVIAAALNVSESTAYRAVRD